MMIDPVLFQSCGFLSVTQTKYTVSETVSSCSPGVKHVYCSTQSRNTIHSTTVSCSWSSAISVSPPGSRTSTFPTCTWTWEPRCCAPASCRSGWRGGGSPWPLPSSWPWAPTRPTSASRCSMGTGSRWVVFCGFPVSELPSSISRHHQTVCYNKSFMFAPIIFCHWSSFKRMNYSSRLNR